MRATLLLLAGWLLLVATPGCTTPSADTNTAATSVSADTASAPDTTVETSTTTKATEQVASSASTTTTRGVRRVTPAGVEDERVRTVAERLEDASVETRVRQALVQRRALRVFDFRPESVGGTVTLCGNVNTPEQRRLVARVARSVSGVDRLVNRVTVQGRLPSAANSTTADASGTGGDASASAVYYTVEAGDSLWKIARDYQVSVRQIKDLNNLRGGNLQPGQRIRIR